MFMLTTCIKKGILFIALTLCFISVSFAQSSSGKSISVTTKTAPPSVQENQPISLNNPVNSSLGYANCNAKSLYEKAFDISISEEEFRSKCKSTMANKQEWLLVRDYFQSDSNVDLTGVLAIINAFDAKM